MLNRLVHRHRPGNQLPHPGVVVEAIPLQTHPPRHRRTGERDRHPTRGGRGEEGGSAKGTRRLSAQERGLRPGACSALEKSHGRGQQPNVSGCSTKHERMPTALRAKRQEALRTEQRNLSQEIIRWTQKEVFAITRKTLADLATTSLEERMGEVFVQPPARVDRRGQGAVGCRPQDLDPHGDACAARSICRRHSATRSKVRSRKRFAPDNSSPVRDRAGAGQRHRALHQRTEGGLEHRGLSRDAGKERRRTSARGCQARIQAGREVQARAEGRSQARAKGRAEALKPRA